MNEDLENFADSVEESTVETTADHPEEAAPAVSETEQTAASPSEEKSSEPAAEHTDEQTMVPLAAKQAEKERRQRAEKELEQLRTQVAQTQNQNKPDFWDNPEQAMANMAWQLKAQMSEEFVKMQNPDYDKVMDHYQEMVQKNPAIYNEAMQTGMPALHAYQTAKKDMQIQEIGDVDKFKEKIRQEIMQEMNAQKNSNVPPNMTTVRSAGSDAEAAEYSNTNDELFDLLEGRKQR